MTVSVDEVSQLSLPPSQRADHDLFWGKKGDKRKSRQWEEYDEIWVDDGPEDEEAEESWWVLLMILTLMMVFRLPSGRDVGKSGAKSSSRRSGNGKWDDEWAWYQPKDQRNQWPQSRDQSNAQSHDQSNDAQGQWRQSQDQGQGNQRQWRQSQHQGQWGNQGQWRQSQDQSQWGNQGQCTNQGNQSIQWIRSDSQMMSHSQCSSGPGEIGTIIRIFRILSTSDGQQWWGRWQWMWQ
eukprot:s560_g14.t1